MVYKGSVIRIDRSARESFWRAERYKWFRHTLLILAGLFVFLASFLGMELLIGGRP